MVLSDFIFWASSVRLSGVEALRELDKHLDFAQCDKSKSHLGS
jgi:hypothetical protein